MRRAALIAILAFALAALLPSASLAGPARVAPASPAFLEYIDAVRAGRAPATFGYVPSPVDTTGAPRAQFAPLMARFPARFAVGGAATGASPAPSPVPATYDLRTLDKLPGVREQGRFGTCWAFAAYASLESSLLPGAAWDFSENNLVHRSGFAFGYDGGGNSYMATAYLVRWSGPVAEADDPYAPSAVTPNPSPADATVPLHVHEALELPSRTSATDTADLKWAIMTYGAVDVSMFWGDAGYNAAKASYYSTSLGTNHEVACVGWDDAYSASNFASRPQGKGAFLVRNSWGSGWGSGGYFWVSYYDRAFASQSTVYTGAEPAAGDDRVYQHDPLGWVTSFRPRDATDPTTAWIAGVFTPAEEASLTAAGFYTTAPNAAYEVRVATSVAGIREAAVSASGTLAVSGYHTVDLTTPVPLAAGSDVVIAVHLTTPGFDFPVALEQPLKGYAAATARAGQSFVSGDGATWTDMTSVVADTDVCLKGYATAVAPAPDPTPTPDPAPSPPSVHVSDAAARTGGTARIAFVVSQPGATTGSATLTLRLRDSSGAVVRKGTLRGVSLASPHVWRVRCPDRRGTYRVAAVARLDTGQLSRRATARLRVR